jgi:1-acyl-sn-glycerol-3-phosphate acyltransferase
VPATLRGFPAEFPVRRDGRRPWRYRLTAGLCRTFVRVLFFRRIRFEGSAGVPLEGPLLVASNHISNWDGLILGSFFSGTLFAMVKREAFRPPPLAWLLAGCNCFPVDRGTADRRALRISLDVLRARGRLLIFIEGHRSRGRGMGPAEAGAGFLVRRTQAPVLPVAIWGTERALVRTGGLLPRRGHLRVRYGQPVTVSGGNPHEIADAIAVEVAALLPPRYRGIHPRASASLRGSAHVPPSQKPGRPQRRLRPASPATPAALPRPPSRRSPGR